MIVLLELGILIACLTAAFALVQGIRHHAAQLRASAALDRALAPQTLKSKYACVMSPAEIREMTIGRWQD